MRAGLDATLELRKRRITVAAWVRHEEGGAPDHHLVLGVADDDWRTGDMRALHQGIRLPALGTSEPTWIDLFPVSEVERLRVLGTVVWEESSPGDDPLDYRYTHERFVPDAAALARFTSLLAADVSVRAVGAELQQLWKGDELVDESVQLVVDALDLTAAMDAARETVLFGRASFGATTGRPVAGTLLYEAA